MKLSQMLEKLWFSPITDDEPLWMTVERPDQMWLTVEAVVPLPKIAFVNLKEEGSMPLYIQEVDLEKDEAILSLVMEV